MVLIMIISLSSKTMAQCSPNCMGGEVCADDSDCYATTTQSVSGSCGTSNTCLGWQVLLHAGCTSSLFLQFWLNGASLLLLLSINRVKLVELPLIVL
jgi:hypothetical protein